MSPDPVSLTPKLMMKYEIHARALARSEDDIASVHARLFQHLQTHSKMCSTGRIPSPPKIRGGNLIAGCELDGFLPAGMSGRIVYQFREDVKTSPISGDDWIVIEFEPSVRSYRDVIDDFIPTLIHAMNPYIVTFGDQKFDDPFIDVSGKIQVGGARECGCELHPVFFLADWRLKQIYNISLEEATDALKSVAPKTTIVKNGLLVIGMMNPLKFEQAKIQVQRIEKCLNDARPSLLKSVRKFLRIKKKMTDI